MRTDTFLLQSCTHTPTLTHQHPHTKDITKKSDKTSGEATKKTDVNEKSGGTTNKDGITTQKDNDTTDKPKSANGSAIIVVSIFAGVAVLMQILIQVGY